VSDSPKVTFRFIAALAVGVPLAIWWAIWKGDELVRAVRDYFADLSRGDIIAVLLTTGFALCAACVVAVWWLDRRWRRQEQQRERAKLKKRRNDLHVPKSTDF
jgi:hypothetical protein